MTDWTPNEEQAKRAYVTGMRQAFIASAGEHAEEWDRFIAAHDRVVAAQAWDEGHKTPHRRGPDNCMCGAWSRIECGCGLYGTGPLESLTENPYRTEESN